jgi:hypothetical protein
MAGVAEKCNFWAQEIGTQNGVLKFGAMSPTGVDGKQSVKIVSTGLLVLTGLIGTQILSPLVNGVTAASARKLIPKPGKLI